MIDISYSMDEIAGYEEQMTPNDQIVNAELTRRLDVAGADDDTAGIVKVLQAVISQNDDGRRRIREIHRLLTAEGEDTSLLSAAVAQGTVAQRMAGEVY